MHEHDQDGAEDPTGGSECQEALDTLYHFLDGELTATKRQDIQRHLDKCSSCLEAFDFEAELKVLIARRCKDTVPDSLRSRIAAAITAASDPTVGNVQPGKGTTRSDSEAV
ncbi:MAG TPA: mycothiol system anti-sigma-R factor [Acidimicrobiales bacterium]|nr:mycothiol system anti-sigma-R factor [Acidimicrobiales bacterium]